MAGNKDRNFGLGCFGLLCLGVLFLFCGCGVWPGKRVAEVDMAGTIVEKGVDSSGGCDAWRGVKALEASAVATVYEEDGGRLLIEQLYRIVPDSRGRVREITLINQEPGSEYLEALRPGKSVEIRRVRGEQVVDEGDPLARGGARVKLFLTGQGLMGAAGLSHCHKRLLYNVLEDKGGRLSHKVRLAGDFLGWSDEKDLVLAEGEDELVCWLDADTGLVRKMWLGHRQPVSEGGAGYMGVEVSGYEKRGDGLVLPRKLEFIPSDVHQHFSRKRLMTVEFQEIKVCK